MQQSHAVPVFVISLVQRPRCGALCTTLSQLDIPYEMIAATDVRACTPFELSAVYDQDRAMRRVGRAMGLGEIGCALSHREAYRRMCMRGIPLALILEEDAVPGPHFKSFWQMSASLCDEIDVLSLYSEEGYLWRRPRSSLADCMLHEATVSLAGTVGYYIRLRCARQLMQSNTPVSMVADWPLALASMRLFLVLPMLVSHPPTGSTIADERPKENMLRRYRVPHWLSGLFHLSYLGYIMQSDRYEGAGSYYHREIARRLRRIIAPRQIDVRTQALRPVQPPPRPRLLIRGIGYRLRHWSYALRDIAAGGRSFSRARRFCKASVSAQAKLAPLKVGCHSNWGDFSDALHFLTPRGSGVWNDVAFVPAGSMRTDWVGIFNQPQGREIEFYGSPNRVFFAIGEPPTRVHRPLHLGQIRGSTVFTCDRELAARSGDSSDYVLTPPMLRTWSVRRSLEQLSTTSIRNKPRKLSWVTSNLSLLPGHRRRLHFLKRLRAGLQFDLYGRGFRRVHDKWDVLAPYRYSIAFENFCAPWYFTEKLMDCYVCETMPIYVGDPTITDFFPADSLVVIDPEAPDVIEQIRAVIQSDAWSRNREAILEAKRRVLYEHNVFSMLSRQIAARTLPASPSIKLKVTALKLVPEEGEAVA